MPREFLLPEAARFLGLDTETLRKRSVRQPERYPTRKDRDGRVVIAIPDNEWEAAEVRRLAEKPPTEEERLRMRTAELEAEVTFLRETIRGLIAKQP